MALPAFNRGQNQSPLERAKNAVNNPNEAHQCKECGSSYFVSRQAEQYSISAYAVRGVSVSPQTFFECIGCGDKFTSGNQAIPAKGGEREMFQASLDLGKEWRTKHNPAQLIRNTVSILEYDALKEELESLKSVVQALIEMTEGETEEEPVQEQVIQKEEVAAPTEKITRPRGRQGKD